MTTYAEAIRFLLGLQLFGACFGLERVRRLAKLAGNPHEQLRFIHVAGTNGKGSVCALLESIYRASGLRTGLFTSPHLIHFGERLQVNRELPSEAELIRLVERVRELLAEGARRGWWGASEDAATVVGLGHPTFFEVVTVMGLIHFAARHCELVIWETGLGGRLDATNLVTPLATVITNVELEHTQVLGNTIAKIAAEKSGIIKPGVPVITGSTDAVALRVIREVAQSRGAPLTLATPAKAISPALREVLAPGYQQTNAGVALAVIEALQPQLPVTPAASEAGLRRFEWPGRLQVVEHGGRRLLIDGAHNPAGLKALRESLASRLAWQPCPVIFGTFADKDIDGVLSELATFASGVWFVPVQSPRSADPAMLAERSKARHPEVPVRACRSLAEALTATQGDRLSLITGSLYLVGEAIDLLKNGADSLSGSERPLNDWHPVGTVPP